MRFAPWLVVFAACGSPDLQPVEPGVAYLTPVEHLVRASMALRGLRPSLDELRRVEREPDELGAIVDDYLRSPEFGATVRELHNEALLVRHQLPELTMPPAGELTGVSFEDINRSMYEEPLRLIEDVVMTGQPYTRIVTADYTMANRIVATIWGMPYDGDGTTWVRTQRDPAGPSATDNAGILTSPALFMRYRSAAANYHRGRANAISRGLLCHDYLEGNVTVDTSVDLADPVATSDAVVSNPACAACHQTLDPLASYFFGYPQGTLGFLGATKEYPVGFYSGGHAVGWFLTTNRPPAYFGWEPVGLVGLGKAIAEDPRFARCAALNFAAYLAQRDKRELPVAWIAEMQTNFAANGFDARRLAREIVMSRDFAESHGTDGAHDDIVGYHKVRPQQLARMLRDLTGYRWTAFSYARFGAWHIGEVDFLDDDVRGYRVLAGGIDSYYVTTPVHTFNATSALVERAAASRAAAFAVERDAAAPADKRALFTEADPSATELLAVRRQIAVLHARVYGQLVEPDAAEVDDTFALFSGALASTGDARSAWTLTLTGMLSDLRALTY